MSLRTIAWPSPEFGIDRRIMEQQVGAWTGARGDWVVLPNSGTPHWSVVASDQEGLRRAREAIDAFTGPHRLDIQQAVPAMLLPPSGPATAVLVVPLEVRGDVDHGGLELMALVRAGASSSETGAPQSLATLLRDFRLALQGQNADRSTELLARLRTDGRLSGDNLRFLQIELLGTFGRWQELRSLEWFGLVARAPRPRQISSLMAEALWRVDFVEAGRDEPSAALLALDLLNEELLALVDAVDIPPTSAGRRLAAVRSVLQRSSSRLDRILEAASPSDLEWIGRLQSPTDPGRELGPDDRARQLFDSGRFIDAVELALELPDHPVVLEIAVRAAAEIEDPDLATRVATALSDETVARLPQTPGFQRSLRQVQTLAGGRCESWSVWFSRVAGDGYWDDAETVARRDHVRWSTDEFRDRNVARAASGHLSSAVMGRNRAALEATLDLQSELAASLATVSEASDLFDAILLQLLDCVPSVDLGQSILGLVQSALLAGPSADRYSDLLDVCTAGGHLLTARVHVPVLLDLLDEFASFPVVDESRRRAFAGAAFEALQQHALRGNLDPASREIANTLFGELAVGATLIGSVAPTSSADDPSTASSWAVLAGSTVFLYTLMDSLAARFTDRLLQREATARVVWSDAHVSSRQLQDQVRSADFVLVDTWHAKHAATIGIDAVCPRSRQILPQGKGTSSFLAALFKVISEDPID